MADLIRENAELVAAYIQGGIVAAVLVVGCWIVAEVIHRVTTRRADR